MSQGYQHKTRYPATARKEEGGALQRIVTNKGSLSKTLGTQEKGSRINEWDLMRLKSLCGVKETQANEEAVHRTGENVC